MDNQAHVMDTVLLIVLLGAPALGLLIMLLDPLLRLLGRLADMGAGQAAERRRRREELRAAHHRARVEALATVNTFEDDAPDMEPLVMSRGAGTEKPRTGSELIRISDAEPPQATKLTELEAARALARLQKVDGSWWLSANKIHEIVGGQRADVLAAVRAERPDAPPEEAKPARVVVMRDRSGEHHVPMVERRERYYADAPALEYQPPDA